MTHSTKYFYCVEYNQITIIKCLFLYCEYEIIIIINIFIVPLSPNCFQFLLCFFCSFSLVVAHSYLIQCAYTINYGIVSELLKINSRRNKIHINHLCFIEWDDNDGKSRTMCPFAPHILIYTNKPINLFCRFSFRNAINKQVQVWAFYRYDGA